MKDILAVVYVFLAYKGLVWGQLDSSTCNKTAAEYCTDARSKQLNDYKDTNMVEAPPKTLCMTQVRADSNDDCFKRYTQLCPPELTISVRENWEQINNEITQACQKDCPNFTKILECKTLVETEEIRDSKFETFCSTFNKSLVCAQEILKDCLYGLPMYMDVYPQTITSYWVNICQSGCRNIDETLSVILTCLQPLATVERQFAAICGAHNDFKQCINSSADICPEAMRLVLYKHKKYNQLEHMCKPTPPPTTTTERTTATPTTETPTTTTTTTTTIKTTTTTDPTTTTTFMSTSSDSDEFGDGGFNSDQGEFNSLGVALPQCLPLKEVQLFSEVTELSQESLLQLLKIDECLHMVYDRGDLFYFLEALPAKFRSIYHKARQQSYITVQRLISECHDNLETCYSSLASQQCNSGSSIFKYSVIPTFLLLSIIGSRLV